MKAKITDKDGFKIAPEGHTVITIPFGEVVEGYTAEVAVKMGKAKRMMTKKPKKFNPVEETK